MRCQELFNHLHCLVQAHPSRRGVNDADARQTPINFSQNLSEHAVGEILVSLPFNRVKDDQEFIPTWLVLLGIPIFRGNLWDAERIIDVRLLRASQHTSFPWSNGTITRERQCEHRTRLVRPARLAGSGYPMKGQPALTESGEERSGMSWSKS